jgi:hypothetical protein
LEATRSLNFAVFIVFTAILLALDFVQTFVALAVPSTTLPLALLPKSIGLDRLQALFH